MKRAVVIGWVVPVKSILHHLIDKPAVDALIEMRRLDSEQQKAQKHCHSHDPPRDPVGSRQVSPPPFQPIAHARHCESSFCWRGWLGAASTRSHAHLCNWWLRIH